MDPDPAHRRRRRIAALVAVALVVVGLGQYAVRHELVDGVSVCIVTEESLAVDRSSAVGGSYSGDDHPADPVVGQRYDGTSGCLQGEEGCRARVGFLWTRAEDCRRV